MKIRMQVTWGNSKQVKVACVPACLPLSPSFLSTATSHCILIPQSDHI